MDYLIAPERIETPDFIIRSYLPGDGILISEAVNNSYEHLKTFMPWAKANQTPEESEIICRQFRGRFLLATDFTMGIFSPSEDRLLGGTGFMLRNGYDLASKTAEVGMWIRANEAGQGLGTAVLKVLLRWGFEEWPWERIFWRCDSDNIASARTAEKAGMIKEGELRLDSYKHDSDSRRSTLIFGALKGEWHE